MKNTIIKKHITQVALLLATIFSCSTFVQAAAAEVINPPTVSYEAPPIAPPIEKAKAAIEKKQKKHARVRALQNKKNREYETKEAESVEYETKEAQEAPGINKKEKASFNQAIDLSTRTLLIFLDDSEIYSGVDAITSAATAALLQEAGPILISGTLLAHIFNSDSKDPHNGKNVHPQHVKDVLAIFYTQFNATQWNIYRLDTFFLLIPRHDLDASLTGDNATLLTETGFNATILANKKIPTNTNDALFAYFNDNNKAGYQQFFDIAINLLRQEIDEGRIPENQTPAHHFLQLFSSLFAPMETKAINVAQAAEAVEAGEAVEVKEIAEARGGIEAVKVTQAAEATEPIPITKTLNWVIYLAGHGGYGKTIADLSITKPTLDRKSQFQEFLDILDKRIKTKLFVYNSCYGAGFNASQVYAELTTKEERIFPFTIVAGATTDAPSTGGYLVTKSNAMQIPDIKAIAAESTSDIVSQIDYGAFVKEAKKESIDYPLTLGYIFPLVKGVAGKPSQIASIPQIRPPYTSAWLPVTDTNKAVIRIGNVMIKAREIDAQARNQEPAPLIIKQYTNAENNLQDPKAVLLATAVVPFTLIIDANIKKIPPFVSLLPGHATHRLKAVTFTGNPYDIQKLTGNIEYGDTKTIIIDELIIVDEPQNKHIFKMVKITIKGKASSAYGTDQYGSRYVFFNNANKAQDEFLENAKNGNTQAVLKAIEKGKIDINAQDINSGDTALHLACQNGHKDIVKILIDNGADTTIQDARGKTVLHNAASAERFDIVPLLLQHDAPRLVNIQDKNGHTALYYPVVNSLAPDTSDADIINLKKMATLLLTYQADPDIKDINGETPRSINPELIASIEQELKNKEQRSRANKALLTAIEQNDIEAIKQALENGANGEIPDRSGFTPLHRAVQNGNLELVQLLLNAGAPVDALNKAGQPPLLIAFAPYIIKKHNIIIKKIITTLIDHKAPVNVQESSSGETPLMRTIRLLDDPTIVRQLILAGADIDIRDNNNQTASDMITTEAMRKAYDEAIEEKEKQAQLAQQSPQANIPIKIPTAPAQQARVEEAEAKE